MRLLPYRTVDDRIDGLVVTFVDVTDQKRAENTLIESEAKQSQPLLQALLATTTEGIAIVEGLPAFPRLLVSRRWLDLIGRSLAEVQQSTDQAEALRLFTPDSGEQSQPAQSLLYRTTRNGEVITNEPWLIERADGEKTPVVCNASPIYDAAGQISGGVLCWREADTGRGQ